MVTSNNDITEEKELLPEPETAKEEPKIKPNKKSVFFSRFKRKLLKHVWVVRILLISGFLSALFLLLFLLNRVLTNSMAGYYAGLAGDFLFTPSEKIKSSEGRTNILILGKGGIGHDAPDLTDTIMFMSVNHTLSASGNNKDQSTTLVSLPRDIWIPELRTKLNSVYYWGNKKEEKGGIILAKSAVEEILDQPVHYAVVIDFSGFKKVIDVLGGIDVDVENSFTDRKYPIAGKEDDLCDGDPEYKCRYEEVKFEKGLTHMDGETALKFVRSRYAEGAEGTDLAREARQQKVIEGIKKKVLGRNILFSPKKLMLLKNALIESTETDVPDASAAIITRRLFDSRFETKTYVLSDKFLENPPKSPKYDNLYVFIPKETDSSDMTKRSWSKVREWVKCVTEKRDCSTF